MGAVSQGDARSVPPILPEGVPVPMPDLPAQLVVNTRQQFKALNDQTRTRILAIIRHQPATAKQIAMRLQIAPGTAGHHLGVLEAAGLAQIVARRQVRGIVAKYYARTARLFVYAYPPEEGDNASGALDILNNIRLELSDAITDMRRQTEDRRREGRPLEDPPAHIGFPHARISRSRAAELARQVSALIDNYIAEPDDPDGVVYGLGIVFFPAPAYVQPSLGGETESALPVTLLDDPT